VHMNMKITVDTEQLKIKSDDALTQIQNVENTFRTITDIVNRSAGYWEGAGQEQYYKAFRDKSDHINAVLLRYRENANELRQIGGIYDSAEKSAVEAADSLPTDVIV